MVSDPSILEIVTALAASVAAIASVWGVYAALKSDWVSLGVSAKFKPSLYPKMSPDTPFGYTITVTNKSKFPVGIADVGFVLKDGQRVSVAPSGSTHVTGMPLRLDSRASHHFDFGGFHLHLRECDIKCVYAKTECGFFKACKLRRRVQ